MRICLFLGRQIFLEVKVAKIQNHRSEVASSKYQLPIIIHPSYISENVNLARATLQAETSENVLSPTEL